MENMAYLRYNYSVYVYCDSWGIADMNNRKYMNLWNRIIAKGRMAKIISLVMCCVLVITSLDITAFAYSGESCSEKYIVGISPLRDEVANQKVAPGAALEDIELPESLDVQVTYQVEKDVASGVEAELAEEFNEETAGVLKEGNEQPVEDLPVGEEQPVEDLPVGEELPVEELPVGEELPVTEGQSIEAEQFTEEQSVDEQPAEKGESEEFTSEPMQEDANVQQDEAQLTRTAGDELGSTETVYVPIEYYAAEAMEEAASVDILEKDTSTNENEESVKVSVEWSLDKVNSSKSEFENIEAGEKYIFVPVITSEGYRLASGVELPTVTVTVEGSEEAFEQTVTVDDVVITVTADEGVFPKDAKATARKASKQEERKVERAIDEVRETSKNVAFSSTYDITITDADENEIEPDTTKGSVRVSFKMAEIANANLETDVYHVEDTANGLNAENLAVDTKGSRADEVAVETDGFSYYTVEFTYGDLQYVLSGDAEVELTDILSAVGLEVNVEITDVVGSNDDLFRPVKASGIWYIEAVNAFGSREWLKVTIDGIEYEIVVTDAMTGEWSKLQAALNGTATASVENQFEVSSDADGITIKLLADFTANSQTTLTVNGNKKLDLNGHVINANGYGISAITVSSSAELTLCDSAAEAVHYYKYKSDGPWVWDDSAVSGAITVDDITDSTSANTPIILKGGAITGGCGVLIGSGTKGGGIYNAGTLTVEGGNIVGNKAGWQGGGIFSNGTFELTNGTIIGDYSAIHGAGIFIDSSGAKFVMNGGRIIYNVADAQAGGVYLNAGSFDLNAGIISYNRAYTFAGGVSAAGTMKMYGGEISYNKTFRTDTFGYGGGVHNQSKLYIYGGSISNNSARYGGGIYNGYNDNGYNNPGTLIMTGGVVTENNCSIEGGGTYYRNGSITFGKTAQITDNTKGVAQQNVYLPSGLTVAIAGGDDAPASGMTVGVSMETGTGCFTTATATEDCDAHFIADATDRSVAFDTSNDTLQIVNGQIQKHDGITFLAWTSNNSLPNASGNYYLTRDVTLSGQWTVPTGANVNLCLNGHVIKQSAANSRVIQVTTNATLNIYDCSDEIHYFTRSSESAPWVWDDSLTSSQYSVTGGVITGGALTGESHGGGVSVDGTFSLYGGNIVGNQIYNTANDQAFGAGAFVWQNGVFNMYGGSIVGNAGNGNTNTGTNGGGMAVGTNAVTSGKFNMYGGTISDNYANLWAGGVNNWGTIVMEGGTIANNIANTKGGGGVSNAAAFTMTGGTVTNNSAYTNGGGVYGDGTVTIGGTARIVDNKKGSIQDNLYLSTGKTVYISGLTAPSDMLVGVTLQGSTGNVTGTAGTGQYAKYFSSDNESYAAVSVGNIVKLISVDNCVASVTTGSGDSTMYETLEAAVGAVNSMSNTTESGTVIKLHKNYGTVASNLLISNSCTIDLGGHTLTSSYYENGSLMSTPLSKNGGITIKNGTISFGKSCSIINTESQYANVLLTCENLTITGTGNTEGAYVNWGDAVLFKNCSINCPILASGFNSGGTVGTVTYDDYCKIKYNISLTKDPTWGQEKLYFKESYHQKAKVRHYSNDSVEVDLRAFIAPGYMWINTPDSDPNHTEYPYMVVKSKTVTLNLNNGSVSSSYSGYRKNIGDDSVYCFTDSLTLPSEAEITRANYIFEGWYDNPEFSGSEVTSATEDGTTYYAKWTLDTDSNQWAARANNTNGADNDGTFSYYTTLAAAVSSSTTSEVTLLKDVTEYIEITEKRDIKLDLNGYTLSYGSDNVIYIINTEAKLTIDDSSAAQTGKIIRTGSGNGRCIDNRGILNVKNGTFTNQSMNCGWSGGAIYSNGTFNMYGGTITGCNSTKNGGGVYIDADGSFNMYDGTICNNTSADGGGVYVVANGSFNMVGGIIRDNTANICGGGVYHYGTFNMCDGVIEGNKSVNGWYAIGGGGVCTQGNATFSGGCIRNNSADKNAGGVLICNNNTIFNGVIITGNTVAESSVGGGVYIYGGTVYVGKDTKITGNVQGGTIVKNGNAYTLTGGIEQNVYLEDGETLLAGIETNVPLSGMSVGVTTATAPTASTPVAITGTNEVDYSSYFVSDNSDYAIKNVGNILKMMKAATITNATPEEDKDANYGYITIDKESAFADDTINVSVIPNTECSLKSLKYNDGSDHDITETKSFTMPAANVTVTAEFVMKSSVTTVPVANTLTYSGLDQALVSAGTSLGGTMNYVVGDNNIAAPSTGWSTSIPTGSNAGTYYVWYKCIGDSTHSDTEPECVTVDLAKAEHIVTAPKALKLTYNGNEQVLISAGSCATGELLYSLEENGDYTNDINDIKAKPVGTYTVYYKVLGNVNYTEYAAASITVKIAKKSSPTPSPDPNPTLGPSLSPTPVEPSPTPVEPSPTPIDPSPEPTPGPTDTITDPVEPSPTPIKTTPSPVDTDSKEDIEPEPTNAGPVVDPGDSEESVEDTDNGIKVRTLPVGDGSVSVDADISDDSPINVANVETKISELIKDSNIFTEKEIEDIKNGEKARLWISIDEVDTSYVSEEEKAKVNEMAEALGDENIGIVYFELQLLKQVGSGDIVNILEMGIPLKVSFELPEDLINTDASFNRKYVIIRIRDGVAEEIECEYDEESGSIIFETDKSSTYVLAYADSPVDSRAGISGSAHTDNGEKAGIGILVPMIIGSILLLLLIFIILLLIRRKKKEEQ